MAHISSNAPASTPFHGLFAALTGFFRHYDDALSRNRQVEALMALSDAELADRGLRRGDIARFVFSDSNWI